MSRVADLIGSPGLTRVFFCCHFFSYLGCQFFINSVYLLSLSFLSVIILAEVIKSNRLNDPIL
jgi:hypothetical protein